ncbi:hypothetical protein DL240_04325 [Lujinxingia litoralis]|uniref:PpiC domain-containing protein n=1 Tax=Lujinxingia litoralis TaxID=2211119 RepID=A0A328CEP5_9DELT|nr:peptidylprolyl isomerase [Lujinxingia litoralis]RAL25443.1 hypothetical protein DL240_04325 [Lujinxingia litoralis]
MLFEKRRLIGLALVAALGGGVVACDSSKQEEAATENAAAEDEATGEEGAAKDEAQAQAEPEEIPLEKLPFHATGPVAKIDGKEVGADTFNDMVRQRASRLPERVPAQMLDMLKAQTVDLAIDHYLVESTLEEANVVATKEDVDKLFNEFRERFPNEAMFNGYLQQMGLNQEMVRENMARDARLEKYLESKYGLEVPAEDVETYYNEHTERFTRPDEVRARHILIKVERGADDEAVATARAKAQEILELAKAEGADFEALAREHSEGPTAPRGGDLGFFGKGRMVPEFSEVAFGMEPNQVSDLVRTQFGFHIIQLVEKRDAAVATLDEVKDDIEVELRHELRVRLFQRFLTELREGATVEKLADNIRVNQEMAASADEMPPGMPQLNLPGQVAPQQGQKAPAAGAGRQLKLDPSLQPGAK